MKPKTFAFQVLAVVVGLKVAEYVNRNIAA